MSREKWAATALGEVSSLIRGISYKASELAPSDNASPFLNLKSVMRGGGYRSDGLKSYAGHIKDKHRLSAGDILIAVTDLTQDKAILGYPTLVPDDEGLSGAVFSLDLAKVEVTDSRVNPDYLFLVLQSPDAHDFMKKHSSGTTVIHLKVKDVPSYVFPLPPLEVQERIVGVVGSVDRHLANLKTKRDTLAAYRSALLSALLTRELVLDGDTEEWTKQALSEVASIQQGKTLAVSDISGGSHPVYGANGVIGWHHEGNIDTETVALGCRGSCGTVHMAPAGAFLANNVMALNPIDDEVLDLDFLAILMRGADLVSTGVIAGQVQPQITRKSLSPLIVPVPPILIQKRAAEMFRSISGNLDSLDTQVASLARFRAALLTALLNGDLEV